MSDHDEIDINRVRERVKRHLQHRPIWQVMLLIWVGIMVSSWLVSGIGYPMMRGRFSWGGSPWVVFFLIILAVVWLRRGRYSSPPSNDDELDRAIRRELRRERRRMAAGAWDDPQEDDNNLFAEKRKRADVPEQQAPAPDLVIHLGDDGELIFNDTPANTDDEAEQHHSAAS